MLLGKFSIGIGDRFAQQAEAQLRACQKAAVEGAAIIPVWNKSNREHTIVGSEPESVRDAACAAVRGLRWAGDWHCDADHINLSTVDRFLGPCDFFTIDVAGSIGKPASRESIDDFTAAHPGLPGVGNAASKYLGAAQEAARIYSHIEGVRGKGNFITEVSLDETDEPQTPQELLVILAALAHEGVPAQTIAPKFSGRFNKGVDYVGDAAQFEREFAADVDVIREAVDRFGLPANLKLSIHSGSDKFSIYPAIRRVTRAKHAGVHLKTAGTTWLEELIGLAEAGGDGLRLAKEIYAQSLAHWDDLTKPYATVIDIDRSKLPPASEVYAWSSDQYVRALRHIQSDPFFNLNVRQLLHVGFKIAAKMGDEYLDAVRAHRDIIARNVTTNIYDRHIVPVFLAAD